MSQEYQDDIDFEYEAFAYLHAGDSWIGLIESKVDNEDGVGGGHHCGGHDLDNDGARVPRHEYPCPSRHPDPNGNRRHFRTKHTKKWLQIEHDYCDQPITVEVINGDQESATRSKRWAFDNQLRSRRPGAVDPADQCHGCLFSFYGNCAIMGGLENQERIANLPEDSMDSWEMTTELASAYLRISMRQVERLIARKQLKARIHKGGFVVSRESVEAYSTQQTEDDQRKADQDEVILRLLAQGMTIRAVAIKVGVSKSDVHRVKKEAQFVPENSKTAGT